MPIKNTTLSILLKCLPKTPNLGTLDLIFNGKFDIVLNNQEKISLLEIKSRLVNDRPRGEGYQSPDDQLSNGHVKNRLSFSNCRNVNKTESCPELPVPITMG